MGSSVARVIIAGVELDVRRLTGVDITAEAVAAAAFHQRAEHEWGADARITVTPFGPGYKAEVHAPSSKHAGMRHVATWTCAVTEDQLAELRRAAP